MTDRIQKLRDIKQHLKEGMVKLDLRHKNDPELKKLATEMKKSLKEFGSFDGVGGLEMVKKESGLSPDAGLWSYQGKKVRVRAEPAGAFSYIYTIMKEEAEEINENKVWEVDIEGYGYTTVKAATEKQAMNLGLSRLHVMPSLRKSFDKSKIKIRLKEEAEEINEKVEIRHDRFIRTHGKKAKGSAYSNWMFTTKSIGNPSDEETASARGTLAAAAKEAADKLGSTVVYVMEELEDFNEEKAITVRELKAGRIYTLQDEEGVKFKAEVKQINKIRGGRHREEGYTHEVVYTYVDNSYMSKNRQDVFRVKPSEKVFYEATSYEKDLNPNKRIVARGVKGMKSKPFTKKFKNMAAYDKWTDSDEYGDYDVQQLFNEAKGSEFKTNNLATWKTNAKSRGLVVRSAVHPDKGEEGIYYTASDKQGNFRGEFFVDKKEGVLVESRYLTRMSTGSKKPKGKESQAYSDMAWTLAKVRKGSSSADALKDMYQRRKDRGDENSNDPVIKGEYGAIKNAVLRIFKSLDNVSEQYKSGKQREWDAAAAGNQNPPDPRVEAYHDMKFILRNKTSKEKLADMYRKRKATDEKSKDPKTMGEWQAIKDAVLRVFKSLENISEHHLKPGTMVTAKEGGKTIKGKVLFDTSDEDGTDSYQYVLNVGGKRVSVSSKSIQETKNDATWGTIYEL